MFTSSLASVEVPVCTLFDYLFGAIEVEDRSRIALVDPTDGSETTYGELISSIEAFAGALAHRNVGVGAVVAIAAPNVPAFAVAFHGVLRAGATLTTVNALYTASEIEKQLADSKASWVITVSQLLPQITAAAAARSIPSQRIIVLDDADGFQSLIDLVRESRTAPQVQVDPSTHVAVMPYSSGTTAAPKGVMLSHTNLVANLEQCLAALDISRDDCVLAVVPFFHIYGMNVILNLSLRQRARLVTMAKFDLEEYLSTVQHFRCTFLYIAPPVAVALAKSAIVDRFDTSSVRTIMSGAAPLDGETGEAVARRLNARMVQGYGMSELAPVSHATPAWRDDIPLSSIGVLLPNQQVKLIDLDSGEEITAIDRDGATRRGEMLIKGPNVMLGYLNRPDATAEAFDDGGFLRTGDVAVMHEGGYFSIVDRVKELIKYKGYQIAPAELEALLLSHPSILDAAVIGVLDDEKQEIPKAFVVRRPDSALSGAEVMEFIAGQVAPYKKVRKVEFIDAIPKSAAGKILRKDLRVRDAAGS